MRKIKFRGATKSGQVVYGDYTTVHTIDGEVREHYITTYPSYTSSSRTYRVKGNSVSQLISADKNGEEVYEGDEITDGLVNVKATFADYAALVGGEFVHA